MNYKVLYRKYRPDNFEKVVGQEYIIKTLINSVRSGNISHAYIFSGPRGTGKTSTAKIFSKAINCLTPNNGSPCGNCDFCKITENPDIIEIDAASHNGVDQIRELIENVKLIPSNGKYKVYIIDEVHMLSTSAFNALLLTLEEPPSHVVFILATTNIENVPITILSRCQRFDFRKISVGDITNKLKSICLAEKIKIDDDAINEIALLSEGGMRDALSILDQLSKNDEQISLELVEKQMKTVSFNTINALLDDIEFNRTNKIIDFIDLLREKAIDYKLFTKKIVSICSKRAKQIKMGAKINRLTFEDYTNMTISLIDLSNKVNIHVDSYTMLELELLKYIVNENENVVLEKYDDNEIKHNKKSTQKTISIKNFDNLVNIRVNNTFVNAKKEYLSEFIKNFNSFINSKEIETKYKRLLTDVVPVVVSDTHAILQAENNHYAYNLNEMLDEIQDLFIKVNKSTYKFIFISKEKWIEEKNKYINNLKNKYVYKMLDENVEDDTSEIIDVADGLFDKNKVEIV